MKIAFYGIKRFYEKHREEILGIINSVYSTGMMFGEENLKLEKTLCRLTGRKFALTVNSCTDALFFALKATGVKPGDEVLVTSFSFIASASPIIRAGAVPVFVDIHPDTFLMDSEDLQKKITPKAKAIIAVHLFGQTLNIEEIESIAKQNNLFLIEDAAQALGAKSGIRCAGGMGNVSCLSFDPTKIISAFGSGGALLTDDEEIYHQVNKLRYHGKTSEDDFEILGYNCRLSAAQCALLNWQIENHLESRINRLREIAEFYQNSLCEITELRLPQSLPENFHIYHKYVIKAKERDKLKEYLRQNGIETMIHYPKILPDYSLFTSENSLSDLSFTGRKICEEVLSLPVYPELETEELQYICRHLKNFYKNADYRNRRSG